MRWESDSMASLHRVCFTSILVLSLFCTATLNQGFGVKFPSAITGSGSNLFLRGGVLRPEDLQLKLEGLQQAIRNHMEESNRADIAAGRKPKLVPFEEFCVERNIDLKEIDHLVEEAERDYDPRDAQNLSKMLPHGVIPDEFAGLAEARVICHSSPMCWLTRSPHPGSAQSLDRRDTHG